ncbi:MAG TPA: hypothetical protein VGB78_01310 [Thermoplasmata archaeon]|jgi:hypothetical protein
MDIKKGLVSVIAILFLTSIMVVAIPTNVSASRTFVVTPSGGDDTENMQHAIDMAVSAGPRSVVLLTAGHFYCNNIVANGFHGTVKGAGMDATYIDTLRGLGDGYPGLIKPVNILRNDFFTFVDSDLKMSDLTFDITAYEPAEVWSFELFGMYDLTYVGTILQIPGNGDTEIVRVGFIAHDGTYTEGSGRYTNVEWALTRYSNPIFDGDVVSAEPNTGTFIVSDCHFEHVDAMGVAYLKDSYVKLTHNVLDGVVVGIEANDLLNSVVEISYNEIDVRWWSAIFCGQGVMAQFSAGSPEEIFLGGLPANGVWLIHHNKFYLSEHADAIVLADYGPMTWGEKSFNAIICDNEFNLDTDYEAVYGFYASNVKVMNNRFAGPNALAGITLGWDYGEECSDWRIFCNDFASLNAALADIYLGPGTTDCKVMEAHGTSVIDLGTDNIVRTMKK